MTTIRDVLDSVGIKSSSLILDELVAVGVTQEEPLTRWWKIHNDSKRIHESVVSLSKQLQILEMLPGDMAELQKERDADNEKIQSEWNELSYDKKLEYATTHAWHSVSPTVNGYRFTFGLKTPGCQYKFSAQSGYKGCHYCDLSRPSFHYRDLSTLFNRGHTLDELIIAQAINALDEYDSGFAQGRYNPISVIELLSDGSFLNEREISSSTGKRILGLFSEKDYVKKVVIESRPEDITRDKETSKRKIKAYLDALRPDQELEIAIGLESNDLFTSVFCANKGYSANEFENVLNIIQELYDEGEVHNRRLKVFSYALVKPPYLDERESVENAVRTGKYIWGLSKKHPDFDISIKYEPVMISEATLCNHLYHSYNAEGKRAHTPTSYWSILELIGRLYEQGIFGNIRIGLREDMDKFKAITANYNRDETLSKSDFVVYDAIQKYVQDNDIVRLLAETSAAYDDESLKDWKESMGLADEGTSFERLCSRFEEEIQEYRRSEEHSNKRELFDKIYNHVWDEICDSDIARQCVGKISENGQEQASVDELENEINQIFSKYVQLDTTVKLAYFELLEKGRTSEQFRARMQFRYKSELYAIWIGIKKK